MYANSQEEKQAVSFLSECSQYNSIKPFDWVGFSYIAINGRTQFRLRLATTTDNDQTTDALEFYSGDAAAANQPQLIVYYYIL
jgi:hypothetical protein